MPQMSGKLSAARVDVALERIQMQERIDASNDLARVNIAAERLVAVLIVACR
jgi:hypothetical protein